MAKGLLTGTDSSWESDQECRTWSRAGPHMSQKGSFEYMGVIFLDLWAELGLRSDNFYKKRICVEQFLQCWFCLNKIIRLSSASNKKPLICLSVSPVYCKTDRTQEQHQLHFAFRYTYFMRLSWDFFSCSLSGFPPGEKK